MSKRKAQAAPSTEADATNTQAAQQADPQAVSSVPVDGAVAVAYLPPAVDVHAGKGGVYRIVDGTRVLIERTEAAGALSAAPATPGTP